MGHLSFELSTKKKDSSKRRVILDLSFLQGRSVNDGIQADSYLGQYGKLTFPSIDDLVKIIHKKGPGCLLFKRDLSKAYRQLRVDVGNIHLLEYWFQDNYFFNMVLPMGLRSAARCCQMFTDAITFIFQKEGFEAVNYIDDFGGADVQDRAWEAFYQLGKIMTDIGVTEATDKASSPSTIMVFLGLEVNTVQMTLKIQEEKMSQLILELTSWLCKEKATRRQTQSLLGLLNFAAGCIRPGRIYFSRILNFLRSFREQELMVPEDVRRDVHWWLTCAKSFNRVSLIMNPKWEFQGQTVRTDACDSGIGSWTDTNYFHVQLPVNILTSFSNINQKECLAILVAIRLWGGQWGRRNIVVGCDNANSVRALNSGASRDLVMQMLLHNINWESVKFSVEFRASFSYGKSNFVADSLLCWHLTPCFPTAFYKYNEKLQLKETTVDVSVFELCCN